MENIINFKYLNILIEFNIAYSVITHGEEYFLYIEDVEKFQKIKEDIEKLKEKYSDDVK